MKKLLILGTSTGTREIINYAREKGVYTIVTDDRSPEVSMAKMWAGRTAGETDRILFVGRYWFACPVEELARRTGLTRRAVHMRIFRTRERLRAYLTERGYGV